MGGSLPRVYSLSFRGGAGRGAASAGSVVQALPSVEASPKEEGSSSPRQFLHPFAAALVVAFQEFVEVPAGPAPGIVRDVFRGAGGDDLAAAVAAFGAEVDDP